MNRVEVDDDVIMNWRPRVNSSSQLNRIPRNVIGLIVNDNSCNDLRELDLSRFEMLESIEIGSNALKNVKNVSMNGLNELIRFGVGSGSLNGVEIVSIGSNSLNSISSFNFSLFSNVRRIEIGSRSMNNASALILDGLNELDELNVGFESMTGVERVDIGSNSLNSISSFDFSLFSNVKVIEIGHESMNQVVNVTANRLGMLQNVRIDDDSLKNTRK